MDLRPEEVSAIIKQQIDKYGNKSMWMMWLCITAGDGIARVYGLNNCMSGELLEFENGVFGMAMNLEEDNIGCVLFRGERDVKEGTW